MKPRTYENVPGLGMVPSKIVGVARCGSGPGTVLFPNGEVATIAERAPIGADSETAEEGPFDAEAALNEAVKKADRVRTPFAKACDELVAVLAEAQDLFSSRFRIHAEVPFLEGKVLHLKKRGNGGRVLMVEGDGVFTPLLSCNLEWRLAAVDALPVLWKACLEANDAILGQVNEAVAKAAAFVESARGSADPVEKKPWNGQFLPDDWP